MDGLGSGEKYHLYIDESGDHVFRYLEEEHHRYLCLLGCWFKGVDYSSAHAALETLKQNHFPHNPDDPVILHRSDIVNRRGPFWRLREDRLKERFDRDLLAFLRNARFTVVAVVIDKRELRDRHETPAHPYHLALGFLLQRYCGYLNHISRQGDVTAESRGGAEDMQLKGAYSYVYTRGGWKVRAEVFQKALTSRELRLKRKSSNITGLQMADILAHPARQAILREKGLLSGPATPFVAELFSVLEEKYNRHLYDGRTWGYGKVLFPK